jgi:hypothetical protein
MLATFVLSFLLWLALNPGTPISGQLLYSQTLIYVLLHIRTFDLRINFFWNASLYIGTWYLIYVLHLTCSNSIYVLSKVCITNTGVRISKYNGSLELHGDFGESFHQDWNCQKLPTLWECWGDNSSLIVMIWCLEEKNPKIYVRELKHVNFTCKWKLYV